MKRLEIIGNLLFYVAMMILTPLLWCGFWAYDKERLDPLNEIYAALFDDMKWELSKWQ